MSGTATRQSLKHRLRHEPPSASEPKPLAAPALHDLPGEDWLPLPERWTQRARPFSNAESAARQLIPAALDFLLVACGGAAAFWLRWETSWVFSPMGGVLTPSPGFAWPPRYLALFLVYACLVVLSGLSQDVYRYGEKGSVWEQAVGTLKAVFVATTLLMLCVYTAGSRNISLLVIGGAAAWNCCALPAWRYVRQCWELRNAQRGENISRVLIIGAGKVGRALAHWLEVNPQLGYHVCGFLDEHRHSDARVLGAPTDLRKVALGQFADQLFLTRPADRETVQELLLEARSLGLNFSVIPDLYGGLAWRAPIGTIGGFPIIELHGEPIPALAQAVKRAMDIIGASALLLLTAPVLAVAAAWICCDSPGPAIYSALRIGKKGRRFRCYKLRTMIAEADAQKEALRPTNERSGPFFKIENDPRVTRCGRWLRKYSVDELPQLINVLLGDMSLVGPRPHPVDDFERYAMEHLRRLDVKPGVTGLWQVTARRDPSFETNMVLDLEYIEDWNLGLDLRILLKTVSVIFAGEGQ